MLSCEAPQSLVDFQDVDGSWLNDNRHGVGYDYIHNDADGKNMRLDVRSQLKYAPFLPLLFTGYYGVIC